MNNKHLKNNNCMSYFTKSVCQGFSLFLIGLLLSGLLGCALVLRTTKPAVLITDSQPPIVTISTNTSLGAGKLGVITFSFSEKVTFFTPSDIEFLTNEANAVSATKGKFDPNSQESYSLEITPQSTGTLYIKIPANSFEDLFGNYNPSYILTNFSVTDDTITTIISIKNEPLIEGKSASLSFTFSEEVTNFTTDDIQFLTNEANAVNATMGEFTTNTIESYSLEITPKASGTLYIKVPDNSFEDISGNQNTETYTTNFEVISSNTTYTVDFKPNGGTFANPQDTSLVVVVGNPIEETQLKQTLSYPPTGPQSNIQAVTRDVFEWRTSGTKYDFSTLVTSDLTLEAVWSNSCGAVETVHPADKSGLQDYVDKAITASPNTNLNHIDTSAITDMANLFKGKATFNGEIGCWNTTKVSRMENMFQDATAFDQDLSGWVVDSVNSYNSIFTASAMESYLDKYPPKFRPATITITTNQPLIKDIPETITFSFSKDVDGFTIDDIEFSSKNITTGQLNTISSKEYSLNITPKRAGILTVKIPAGSVKNTDNLNPNITTSASFSVTDKTPPTVTSIKNELLIEGKSVSLSFTFSEEVTNFTTDDIQILLTGANAVNATMGELTTNTLESYSLEITPQATGTLYIKVPDNSFEDLSSNQNTGVYTTNFTVFSPSYTISFLPNSGAFVNPQTTTLTATTGEPIEETQLKQILSYPPTGPQPNYLPITRDVFEWQVNETKYDLSTLVTSDLTLKAVWSNSCDAVETFHPTNKTELKAYTDQAIADSPTTNLNHIDTSAITDMSLLFSTTTFNGNIECWNTAKVSSMQSMLAYASAFNGDISKWDVSSVINMQNMFWVASAFNGDISKWDVSSVTDMISMFLDARAFNQNIGKWNVSNVTNVSTMFADAHAFDQYIGDWDVSSVTDMSSMFLNAAAFNQNIGKWNVSNVTDVSTMFADAHAFDQYIGDWDVSSVNNMSGMFSNATAFDQNISTWDVSSVTDMSSMFQNATAFNQDLSGWPVGAVTSYNDIFTGSGMASETSKHPIFP